MIKVDLPAPFSPINPTTVPLAIEKEILSKVKSCYFFDKLLISIAYSIITSPQKLFQELSLTLFLKFHFVLQECKHQEVFFQFYDDFLLE